MDEKTLQEFTTILLEEQQDLLTADQEGEESARPVELDQTSVGRLSRMDAIQSQAMAVAARQRRQVQLQRIAAALERIDDGEFGICAACDEDIPIRRLEVDPAAPFCIHCAAKMG